MLDARTIRVAFTTARAAQLLAFTISVLLEHIYGRDDITTNAAGVGSGPYQLARRAQGQSILLTRRANYWHEPLAIAEVLFRPLARTRLRGTRCCAVSSTSLASVTISGCARRTSAARPHQGESLS